MEQKSGALTLRACKNTLGRLKVQILFRLLFVLLSLLPLMVGFGAWRMYLVLMGLFLMAAPQALLCFRENVAGGVFNTQRAYDIIGYAGFFPERKIDTLLADWQKDKKHLAVTIALLVLMGYALNIRSIVRLCASFIHINSSLPHPKGSFDAYRKRFMQGLGIIAAASFACLIGASLLSHPLIDVAGRSRRDPYRIRMAVSQEEELQVIDRIACVLRDEAYFYYVDIPFNENGFSVLGGGKQRASYLAQVSHANGTQEMWEIALTLNEDRSAAWSDAANVIHPIHFDTESGEELVYISGSEEKMMHYRDDSGSYVQVPYSDAPAAYQALVNYILLDSADMEMLRSDPEHLAADAAEDFIHICYETEDMRITIGVKDSSYPYEVSYRKGEFSYTTRAIRFDNIHLFTLP